LAGVKDIFMCEIVGYAMDKRMTQKLIGQALFKAVQQKCPPSGLIRHSDRGSLYYTKGYQDMVKQFRFETSMPRRGKLFW
jgi:putative transposase